jgi:hypothetical protein
LPLQLLLLQKEQLLLLLLQLLLSPTICQGLCVRRIVNSRQIHVAPCIWSSG